MAFTKLPAPVLRQHKGRSFPGITVVFFCHDGQGNFLLGKRGPLARDEQGTWVVGGGGLKHGESAEAALVREVQEEYLAKPLTTDFIGYFDVLRADAVSASHWIALCFAVLVDRDQIEIGEPGVIDQLDWFTLDTMPTPLHSQMTIFVDKFRTQLEAVLAH